MAHRILFDKRDQYVSIVSAKGIIVISMHPQNRGQIVQEYMIDIERYTGIFDIIMDSKGATKNDQF